MTKPILALALALATPLATTAAWADGTQASPPSETQIPSEQQDGMQSEPGAEQQEPVQAGPQEAILPITNEKLYTARQASLTLGVGVINYNGDIADNVDAGGNWNLRGSAYDLSPIGIEAGFLWGAQDLDGIDPDRNVTLDGPAITTSGSVAARWNVLTTSRLRPFVSAGVGVLNLSFRDQNTTVDDGTAFTIPLGAGLQYFTKSRLVFGGRFDYQALTDAIDNNLPSGDNWNVGVNVGATF